MPYLLGLDIGTTNTKAVLYDLEGQAAGPAVSAPTPVLEGAPGQAMHDPEALYRAACDVIRRVLAQVPDRREVCGLGVSSMAEAGVPLDAGGRPVYPIIAWHDERTVPYLDWWRSHFDDDRLYALTGLQPRHIYSLNKIMWLRDHEPATYRRLACWLSVSDYVAYRLSGVAAMSYPQACRTLALDLHTLGWSEEILGTAGLDPALFPRPVTSGQALGNVRPEAAADCGLSERTLVAAGGHDHICAAVGSAVTAPGTILDSIGTTEALLAVLDRPESGPEMRKMGISCGVHAVAGRFYQIGGILGVGPLLSWLLETILQQPASDEGYRALIAAAEAGGLGAHDLYLLPFLAGAGSPHGQAQATGVYLGLRLHHTRADLVRAAFEGLCYELRHLLESFGGGDCLLRAVGGGARNAFWLQLRADVSGRTLEVPAGTERGALGAALLAGLGAGLYADLPAAAAAAYRAERAYRPEAGAHQEYSARYERTYRRLYEAALLVQGDGK